MDILSTKREPGVGAASRLVARNVGRIRELRGVSQADLGRYLGRSRSWVNKLESGETRVTVDDLLLVAMALTTAPAWLLSPHQDEDLLEVRIGPRGWRFERESMLGWISGTEPPDLWSSYEFFWSAPPPARRYANAVLDAFEDAGWITREVVDGDERVSLHPGGRDVHFPYPYGEREEG